MADRRKRPRSCEPCCKEWVTRPRWKTTGRGVVALRHTGLRIVRGLAGPERDHLLACWVELWRGAIHSHREFMRG